MSDLDPSIAHISCSQCGQSWQVLNEEGTDWDEQKTALAYQSHEHLCEPSVQVPE